MAAINQRQLRSPSAVSPGVDLFLFLGVGGPGGGGEGGGREDEMRKTNGVGWGVGWGLSNPTL